MRPFAARETTTMTVRVRFAPSPTGSLHVGGARTALYNLLFARHEQGAFILRIEDTDVERNRPELADQILRSMEWLSLAWDEGPYFQSQRYDLYRQAAERLLADGRAYRAFESAEELDAERKKAEAAGRPYRYSGAGRRISPEESERRARAGERFVVRLAMPAEPIVVEDLVRGRVEFPAEALDDFVLVRSDGHPLYHFSVCVDDAAMKITHVIRGDDHLANTPKHVALFRALGFPPPRFAHLGMIYGTDRKKLSKRHGAASVEEWRDLGILPEALTNFLGLLGWSPGDDREVMPLSDMIRDFTLDRVGASPSIFDPEKLYWMNQRYIQEMPAEELFRRAEPFASGPFPARARALAAVELHRPRVRTLKELAAALGDYARDPETYDADGVRKQVKPDTPELLRELAARFAALEKGAPPQAWETALRKLAEEKGLSAGKLIHPARLAVTGKTVGAPLFDVLALLGQETVLRRMETFATWVGTQPSGGATDPG
jgi:glutamyl-tRNA synthetase